ncbi:unnamed protein product [Nezara viridula]|uniref:Pyruvate kinase n=1 Tax=Nezara viridula TaxID=85310 RepID=A0A9P0HHY9_NEZVI|nr:unnamed protein product [Nezara viridula]
MMFQIKSSRFTGTINNILRLRRNPGMVEIISRCKNESSDHNDDEDEHNMRVKVLTKQHLYPTYMQYISTLDVNSNIKYTKKAGIICTIGPASRSVDILVKMMDAGMDMARLNFSHGTHDFHRESIVNIRKAVEIRSKRAGRPLPIAIALDTKGPEVRTGLIAEESKEVDVKNGTTMTLHTEKSYFDKGTVSDIYIDLATLPSIVKPGTVIYIDDGLIELKVLETGGTWIKCFVENGGKLGSQKGVNIPGSKLNLPAISEKDKLDIRFAMEQDIDIIFASFIRRKEDVFEIRKEIDAKEDYERIRIVSKIENHEGIDNVDEITDVSDGIMVARGDLGIEISSERVFLAQKRMIASCNLAGKPVICATQMLESMVKKPRPTRAESSDVANAILDGADCVMLSAETAKGKYPVKCVQIMVEICKASEEAVQHMKVFQEVTRLTPMPSDKTTAVAIAAVAAANKTLATAILVMTTTGYSAFVVAKFRPPCNIFAITAKHSVARKCFLYRGIIPVIHNRKKQDDWSLDTEQKIRTGLKAGLQMEYIHKGDMVVVMTGWKKGRGNTSTMRLIEVTDEVCRRVFNEENT